jgi:hypothetical protein
MNETFKEYYYNRFFIKIFLVLAVICACIVIIGLAFSVFSGRFIGLSAGTIIPIIFYFMYRNFVVLRILNTHIEIRVAPLRAKELIDYKDIQNLESDSRKIILHRKYKKPIKLALSVFNKDQRQEIIETLKQKIS